MTLLSSLVSVSAVGRVQRSCVFGCYRDCQWHAGFTGGAHEEEPERDLGRYHYRQAQHPDCVGTNWLGLATLFHLLVVTIVHPL